MIQGPQLLIVLAIVLLLFGGSKLPKLARGLGEAQKEFREGLKDDQSGESANVKTDGSPTAPPVEGPSSARPTAATPAASPTPATPTTESPTTESPTTTDPAAPEPDAT